jgi:hypothetical protein
MRQIAATGMLLAMTSGLFGQILNDLYSGKRVLSIGASQKVLTRFSDALTKQGFVSTWTTNYEDVEGVLNQFNALDFDVIAFGRGVSDSNKLRFKQKFKEQNPDITFVDGLAPITNLLVDQIKLACMPRSLNNVAVNTRTPGEMEVIANAPTYLTVKQYRLNRFYQKKEKMIFEEIIQTGQTVIRIPKRPGIHFLVLSQDGIVFEIIDLNQLNQK